MQAAASMTATRRAELILHEVESLPTLPAIAMRLMKITSADDADLKEIIRLIETDPALTAKVLSMCRRAELGLGSRVTTVERAVLLLGLETLKSIVLGLQVMDWSSGRAGAEKGGPGAKPAAASGFDREAFWRHCIGVACCAEMLATKHRELEVNPGEAFVAGLLHDLGKVGLQMVLPQAYAQVIEMSDVRQANIADIEKQVIGLDHHTAGKRLAERWELPPMLVEAIWLHGQRYEALPAGPHRKLVGLVWAADMICRTLHLGWSGNHPLNGGTEGVCRGVGLNAEKVESLLPHLLEVVSERCTDLGLGEAPTERMIVDALASANRQLSRLNTAIERRTRHAAQQARVLETMTEFLTRVRPEQGTVETLTDIVRSAVSIFGEGACVVVFDPGIVGVSAEGGTAMGAEADAAAGAEEAGEAGGAGGAGGVESPFWIVLEHDETGNRLSSDVIDRRPAARNARIRLSAETLEDVEAARELLGRSGSGMLNLLPRAAAMHEGAGAVLLHGHDEAVRALGRKLVGMLLAAWGVALGAALREEAGARLGEQLAEANRVLADMQRELADAQSMARLAELTAGAAHEFNNPLAVISGRGQLLATTVVDPKHKTAVAAIVQASRQLSDLVHRLHIIARPPAPAFAATPVREVLGEAVKRAVARAPRKTVTGEPVSIRVSVPEHLGPARLDRELMTQAMTEVLVNALEADPRDFVDVRVQTDVLDDRLIVQVTDTGRGMLEHAVTHALDPFFSDKPAGRQPGLGLTLAHRLLRMQGGSIRIESQPGDGTIVTIALRDWRWKAAAGTSG